MIGRGEDMTSNDDMTDFYEQLAGVVPLQVREVEFDDPLVTIFGADWSLNLSCPWDLVTTQGTVGWEDPRLEDAVWDLVGLWLRRIGWSDDGNPIFVFDQDYRVVVHAETDIDPWALRVPDFVFVGSQGGSPAD